MTRYSLILALFLAGCAPTNPPGLAYASPRTARLAAAPAKADNGWPDRRPIGWVYLASGGDDLWPGERTKQNPRGWIHEIHSGLDVADPDYAAKFAASYKRFVSLSCIPRGVKLGCQILMFKDIEGEEFDVWTTYNGDPVQTLPPEMPRSLVKWTVDECKKNGLGVGFLLRHTLALTMVNGEKRQLPAGDPATVMAWKMFLIRQEYGDNVLAVEWDSPIDLAKTWNDGTPRPLAASVLSALQQSRPPYQQHPGWLLIPEYGSTNYNPRWGNNAYLTTPRVAPYRKAEYPADTATQALQTVRGAFEVVLPTDAEPTPEQYAAMVRDFRNGSIPAVTVTWDNPHNVWQMRAYAEAKGK